MTLKYGDPHTFMCSKCQGIFPGDGLGQGLFVRLCNVCLQTSVMEKQNEERQEEARAAYRYESEPYVDRSQLIANYQKALANYNEVMDRLDREKPGYEDRQAQKALDAEITRHQQQVAATAHAAAGERGPSASDMSEKGFGWCLLLGMLGLIFGSLQHVGPEWGTKGSLIGWNLPLIYGWMMANSEQKDERVACLGFMAGGSAIIGLIYLWVR